MRVQGKVVGFGEAPHQTYVDGTERKEIWIQKRDAGELPYQVGRRVAIALTVGSETYTAGLRSSSRDPHVRICPDLYDAKGCKVRMVDILQGYRRNEPIELYGSGKSYRLRRV